MRLKSIVHQKQGVAMALIATGVGSGLDIEGLIGQLMAAERLPVEQRLIKRETEITQDISALGSLKGALSTFQSTLSSVNAIDTYEKRNASSSSTRLLEGDYT